MAKKKPSKKTPAKKKAAKQKAPAAKKKAPAAKGKAPAAKEQAPKKKVPAAKKKAAKAPPPAKKKKPAATKRPPPQDEPVSLAGWDAITDALKRVHGDQEPRHYGTVIKWALGGRDPLDGISNYKVDLPVPHWHIVGYGLSELYEKESDEAEDSGWGFELTMRVARAEDEQDPPMWAMSFLQNLARYVFSSGNSFAPYHHMDLNGPIALNADTAIRAALFARDPQLPPIDTPNGKLSFVQVVGITGDELDAVVRWNCEKFLDLLDRRHPLLVTDLSRRSILEDPQVKADVHRAIETEGSSVGAVFIGGSEDDGVAWRMGPPPVLVIGAKNVPVFQSLLRGRIRRGEDFWLLGQERRLHVTPGQQPAAGLAADEATRFELQLPAEAAQRLAAAVAPRAGIYRADGAPVEVEVVPTTIRDSEGNVTEVVG